MGQRWSVQGSLGSGHIGKTVDMPGRTLDYTVSGTLGFKTGSHMFMFNSSRDIVAAYLEIAGSTRTVSGGAWSWSRVGSAWSIQSSYSYYAFHGSVVIKPGWSTTTSVERRLSPRLALSGMYVYQITGSKSQIINNVPYSEVSDSVMLSLTWHPGMVFFR
jgi:hypothetical protein